MAAQGFEHFALARPGDALTTVDEKQCAVMGAFDQLRAGLQQAGLGRPLQGDAAMRAAVAVQVRAALPTHPEEFEIAHTERAAGAFGQGIGGAQKIHGRFNLGNAGVA